MHDDPTTPVRSRQVEHGAARARACDSAQFVQEAADALFTLLNVWSRQGSFSRSDSDRLGVIEQIAVALVGRVANRTYNIDGHNAASAFRAATLRAINNNSKGNPRKEK